MQQEVTASTPLSSAQMAIKAAQEMRRQMYDQWLGSYEHLRTVVAALGIPLAPLGVQIAFQNIPSAVKAQLGNAEHIVKAIQDEANLVQAKAILEGLTKEKSVFMRMSQDIGLIIELILKAAQERIKKFELASQQISAYGVIKDILALPELTGNNDLEKAGNILGQLSEGKIFDKINSAARAKQIIELVQQGFILNLAGGNNEIEKKLQEIKAVAEQRIQKLSVADKQINAYTELKTMITSLPELVGIDDLAKAQNIGMVFSEKVNYFPVIEQYFGENEIEKRQKLYNFFTQFSHIQDLAGEDRQLGQQFFEIALLVQDISKQEREQNPELEAAYNDFIINWEQLTGADMQGQISVEKRQFEILGKMEHFDFTQQLKAAGENFAKQGKLANLLISADQLLPLLTKNTKAWHKITEIKVALVDILQKQVKDFKKALNQSYAATAVPSQESPRLVSKSPRSVHTSPRLKAEVIAAADVSISKQLETIVLEAFAPIMADLYAFVEKPVPDMELTYPQVMDFFKQMLFIPQHPVAFNNILFTLIQKNQRAETDEEYGAQLLEQLRELKEKCVHFAGLFVDLTPEELVVFHNFISKILKQIDAQIRGYQSKRSVSQQMDFPQELKAAVLDQQPPLKVHIQGAEK